jgi:hypothetical protein
MSDILVLDGNTALDAADVAASNASILFGDADTQLGGLPNVIASLPEIVVDVVDHVTAALLPSLELDGVLGFGLGGLLEELPGALGHVLDITPGLVGGSLLGLGQHADGSVDVMTNQTLGVTSALNPILDPVAGILNDITLSLGVTDELPARLSALTGIAILGSDSIVHNVAGILDASLGLNLEPTVDSLVGSLGLVLDDLTISLGLGHVLDLVDVGIAATPVAAEGTVDQSGDASHGLLSSLFGDAHGLGDSESDSSLGLALHGLLTGVPTDVDSAAGIVLTDTLDSTVPDAVDHTTVGVGDLLDNSATVGLGGLLGGSATAGLGGLLNNSATVGVGSLLDDPTTAGTGLGADVDQTVHGVTSLVDDSATGLGLDLHLGGIGLG